MELAAYLAENDISDAAFGARVGASQQHINRVKRRLADAGPKLARRIEDETGGAVTMTDLYARCGDGAAA